MYSNIIYVPDDSYKISAGSFIIKNDTKSTTCNYNSETNTSEHFINNTILNMNRFIGIYASDKPKSYVYRNQNYITYDFVDDNYEDEYLAIVSNISDLSEENYWMYPVETRYTFMNTWNFPVTRTISIIINSNTLPVYTIDKDITLTIDTIGSQFTLVIPAGEHSYSTVDDLIIHSFDKYDNHSMRFTNYYNIPYFQYTRFISSYDSSIFIHDNPDFNKYYGLLHMVYTHPANHGFNTNLQIRKFSTNMAPVYRSLNIPTGLYTAEDFVKYINTHSEYHYTRANTDSLSYTQFLAKIVDNDIVIYTDDGTEFFINPICKLNVYKESNFASEHRLCPVNYISYLTESIIVKQGDQINISADKLVIKLSDNTIATDYIITCKSLPNGLTWSNNILTGVLNQTGIFTVYFNINTNNISKDFVLYLISI